MRTRILLGAWLLNAMAIAQTPWVLPGNNSINPSTDYLGTQNNAELVLRTDALFRFRLNKTETYGSLGGFTTIPANGFGLLTPNNSFLGSAPGPFSLFHLADGTGDNAQELGYRPWMRVGLSLTGNADQGYLGHKYTYEDPEDYESGELEDFSDMVIQWSDNPGKWLKDRMRFIFTSTYDESTTGAGSLEGLEGMRLFPVDDDNVNVGIGDWYAANVNSSGAITEPEERLDIVDGKVRIRQLPDDAPTEDEKVMVVDDAGVVHWRPIEDFAGQTDCDWVIQNAGSTGSSVVHNVITAVGTDDD